MRKFAKVLPILFLIFPFNSHALTGMAQDLGGATFYNFSDGTTGISQDLGGTTFYNFTSPSSDGSSGYTCKSVYDDGYQCTTQSDYDEKKNYYESTQRAYESGSFSTDSNIQQLLTQCQNEINEYQTKLKEFNECEEDYNNKINTESSNSSTYDSLIDSINSIYESSCISKYGAGAFYNVTENICECKTGYAYDSANNKCITHTKGCKNDYGVNAYAKLCSDNHYRCYCLSGYALNFAKTRCIPIDNVCHEWHGIYSKYITSTKSCGCYSEYQLNGLTNKCEKENEELNNSNTNTGSQNAINIIQQNKINEVIAREKINLSEIDNNLSSRLKGKILLQVESKGEAWYVNPKNEKKYYMANGEEAYSIMRDSGVGITNTDLERTKNDTSFAKKHSGKIFLQVEDLGQAYYVDFEGVPHYLKNGEEAYNIMRDLGLGIANSDLRRINIGD